MMMMMMMMMVVVVVMTPRTITHLTLFRTVSLRAGHPQCSRPAWTNRHVLHVEGGRTAVFRRKSEGHMLGSFSEARSRMPSGGMCVMRMSVLSGTRLQRRLRRRLDSVNPVAHVRNLRKEIAD